MLKQQHSDKHVKLARKSNYSSFLLLTAAASSYSEIQRAFQMKLASRNWACTWLPFSQSTNSQKQAWTSEIESSKICSLLWETLVVYRDLADHEALALSTLTAGFPWINWKSFLFLSNRLLQLPHSARWLWV